MQLSQMLLAGTAVGICRSRCSGAVQMGTGWIGDLNEITVLPAIRLGISIRNTNVSPVSFGFRSIHTQAPIALFGHRRVSLPICSKAHHQLRHTHRQRFVLIGVPDVPCLPIGMRQVLHKSFWHGNHELDACRVGSACVAV